MENFAPVIIFAFNRPNHLSDLLNSLEKNDQAKFTDFYFFIDKYANESDSKNNLKVIEIAKKLGTLNQFQFAKETNTMV